MNSTNEQARNYKMKQQLNQRMSNQSSNTQTTPESAYKALKQALPAHMIPGNLGQFTNVIWPFWFTFSTAELAPNTGANTQVTITQEAAFILMSLTKTVFKRTGVPGAYIYTAVNALDPNEGVNNANDLRFTLRDAQSSRVFLGQPMSLDEIGCAEYPTVLPTTQYIQPNSTIECIYQNNDAAAVYVPFLTMFGYRVRSEYAQQLLSTITGK
jgi:hypothetical protein